ncbi:formylglycine-generating enzyme family protein [Roseofilum casamattae]|nr:formylglycine-generating enzyme family protein [Roseofilum casamattae]
MGFAALGYAGSLLSSRFGGAIARAAKPLELERSLQKFSFETVAVNLEGEIAERQQREASYFREDLGDGVGLEMVQITPRLYMGKFLITQAQWRKVAALEPVRSPLDGNPSEFTGDRLPVESVSIQECQEFCDRLSRHTGRTYRLPLETEWEYACRAGTTTAFHYGPVLTRQLANYGSHSTTTAVGRFPANPLGLYDMHGNVWEWCHQGGDRYLHPWSQPQYVRQPIRGGSWLNQARRCRSVYGLWFPAPVKFSGLGLRVVRSIEPI